MKTVTIVAFDNFTDVDVFLPWDLFNRARVKDKSWNVKIVGTKDRHISSSGLTIDMHGTVEECAAADIVFFASGSGTRKLYNDSGYLKRFNLDPQRQVICSMCSGALILAGLGLLEGITATTYPTTIDLLKSLGVEVEEKSLVTHGNIGTAAGCLAALELVGWALEKTSGPELKDDVLASVMPVGKGLECIY